MRRTSRIGVAALAATLLCAGASAEEVRPPSRIVSLNLCTDELVLRLVPPDRIASVTWLSRDPRGGNMAEEARRVPANHGLAEEVLTQRPDLVVTSPYATRTTVALLKRAGLRVVEFDAPRDIAGVISRIKDFAALVGETARGEAIVADMTRRLDGLDRRPAERRLGAFVLSPNGFTAGRGSLVDDILTRAGLDNLAARLDLGGYAQVPLERVVLQGADILVVDAGRGAYPSLATALLDHPVFRVLGHRLSIAAVPSRLWTCAGPGVVDAVEILREAASGAREGRP